MFDKHLKNEKRELRHRVFMIAVALIVLVTATVAWFSLVKKVDATGMQTNGDEEPNLVIGTNPDDLVNMQRKGEKGMAFAVSLTSEELSTKPTTHSSNGIDASGKVDLRDYTCLKRLVNPNEVDVKTGKSTDTSESPYIDISTEDPKATEYYKDYIVYIASFPKTMKQQKIKANLSGNVTLDEHNAFSVDVFSRKDTDPEGKYFYAGSLNLSTPESVELYNGEIPGNKDGYVEVLLRCYFDGGLGPDNSKTYINSYSLNTRGMSASVTFRAADSNN